MMSTLTRKKHVSPHLAPPKGSRTVYACSFIAALLYPITGLSAPETLSRHNAELGISVSQTNERLQWSIASDKDGNATPNILSELTYKDLKFEHIKIWGSWQPQSGYLRNLKIGTEISFVEATAGMAQDSDYDSDDRQDEFSRSHSDSSRSDGKEFRIWIKRAPQHEASDTLTYTFEPKIGYHYRQRHLTMHDGVQIINTRSPGALGPFSRYLDSFYEARWYGFDLGLETLISYKKHAIRAEFDVHLFRYYAEADWNLREQFAHPVSFAHWAGGYGRRLALHYTYALSDDLTLSASVFQETANSSVGTDIVYYKNGDSAETQLNGADWESEGISIGINHRW